MAPMRGQVVFDSAWHPVVERAAVGFTMMGNRRLVVTDLPAIYVHDTGGMGAPYVAAAEPAAEPAVSLGLAEQSSRLVVSAQLPAGRSYQAATTTSLPREARAALTGLRGQMLPAAGSASFVTGCAVSVVPEYEAGPGPELLAYAVVAGGRLQLYAGGEPAADWPAGRVTATPTGSRGVRVPGPAPPPACPHRSRSAGSAGKGSGKPTACWVSRSWSWQTGVAGQP